MNIRYLKSATIAIETNNVKIISDPWLVDGEYYGSWYHYPPFNYNEDYFNDVDYIYVSHIHPDHFSKKTFNLLNKNIPVLIHTYESKFLKQNIERLGFKVIELPHNQRIHLKNGVYINILAADNCNPELCARFFGCGIVESKYGSTQIDTLCIIDDGKYSVLNSNDCPFELSLDALKKIKEEYKTIDFLLVGYGGAGPYPQCFVLSEEERTKGVENKKKQFLKQGESYINFINPRFYMPFAGTYTLGGKLHKLQNFRGVPEQEEGAEYFSNLPTINHNQSKAVILNTYEYFNIESEKPSKPYQPVNMQEKQQYIDNILSKKQLDYEKEEVPAAGALDALFEKAYSRMEAKRNEIGFSSSAKVLIRISDESLLSISMRGEGYKKIPYTEKDSVDSYVLYDVDSRLLHWILQGPRFAHWNNAEIGSHITFERKPNTFERGLYHTMCFFHS